MKRTTIFLGLVVLLIIGIAASCTGGEDTGGTSTPAPTQNGAQAASDRAPSLFPGQQEDDNVTDAGLPLTQDDVVVTASPIKTRGNMLGSYFCSTVSYVNNNRNPEGINPTFDWKLQTPDGVIQNPTITGLDGALRAVELVPGGKASGDVCFEKSDAKGLFVLINEGAIFSGRMAWLNSR